MLRQRPIPWAYRVFFRHIGLDPDTTRTPVEQLALDRMHDGSFKSRNRLDDALTIAIAEVGVARPGLRRRQDRGPAGPAPLAPRSERFEGRASPLPTGDDRDRRREARRSRSCSASSAEGRGVTKETKRTTLVAIRVKGVPDVALEEALWVAASAMLA